MKRKVSELKMGVVLSYVNLAIGSIIPMIYTPIMLRLLGKAEYGLYSLSSSVIGYLSLLNFGMGSTIVRYVTKYRVENNKQREQETIGLFLTLYCILAALVLVGGGVLAFGAPTFFSQGLTEAEIEKLQILIAIMAVNTAVSFPISVFSSVIIAHERYIFSRCIDMLSTIVVPVANIAMLYLGLGSVGMASASVIIQFLMLPLSLIFCFRKLDVKPVFVKPDIPLLKEILGFSAFTFIAALVDMLFWATDKVILGALAGSVIVAVYNVGATFNTIVEKLSTTISGVLIPRITGMVVLGAKKEELTELFIRIGRIQFLVIGLVVSGFITFGQPFVLLWAGEGYEEAYVIALLTMIPLIVPLIQTVGKNIVVAQNRHQFRAVVYLIIAILNVISTYLFVPYLGGIGAALCSCVSYIVGQGIIMNIYYQKITGLDIVAFWRNILRMSIIPVILTVCFRWIVWRCFDFYNVRAFLAGVVIYTVLYCVLMYVLMMNDYEKNLISKPIQMVMQKIRRK